jgi:hypothetical protein
MDDAKIFGRQPNVAIDKAVLFSMRNLPLLEQGTTYDPLATAENLWVNIKVYASGGENALHAHGGEDHSFIVLQGKAAFEADEAENLVLLRVGGGQRTVTGLDDLTPFGTPKDILKQTSFADGSTKVGNSPKNGETSKTRVYAKGKFFAPD